MKIIPAVMMLLTTFTMNGDSFAQGSAGSDSRFEPRFIIDFPTAGILPHGFFSVDMEYFRFGGALATFTVGAFDRLAAGCSYGGSELIGSESPSWNSVPGVHLKLRVLDESFSLPAIALGFDSQGKEEYVDSLSRYAIKSPGVYIVASKNYSALGFLSLHAGVNYSLERADGDKDPNVFVGAEKTLGPFLSIVAEYDFAVNDSHNRSLGSGEGYLNGGVFISFGNGLTMHAMVKDLTKNQPNAGGRRTIGLEIVRSL